MKNDFLTNQVKLKATCDSIKDIMQAEAIEFFLLKDGGIQRYKNYESTFQCSSVYIKIDSKKVYTVIGTEEDFGPPINEFYCLALDENLVGSVFDPTKSGRYSKQYTSRSLDESDLLYFDSVTRGDRPIIEIVEEVEEFYTSEGKQINSTTVERGILFHGKEKRVLICVFQLPYNILVTSNEELIENVKQHCAWAQDV